MGGGAGNTQGGAEAGGGVSLQNLQNLQKNADNNVNFASYGQLSPWGADMQTLSGRYANNAWKPGSGFNYAAENFTPVVTTTTNNNDTSTTNTGYTGAVDANGVPAPYLGVDQYDLDGNDSFLSNDEIASYENDIAKSVGLDSFDATKTAESQMTPEQYANWQSQSMSNPGQLAADAIYNNNQQIYGEPTGNNITSLVTGNATGLSDAGIKELQSAPDDKTWAGDSSPLTSMINQQADDYASTGKVFDMNDPSTWADNSSSSNSLVDSATGLVSGGGDDGVGNFGKVGDFFGNIGDAIGITDYSGEAAAKAEAEAKAAAEAQAALEAQQEAARRQAELDAAAAQAAAEEAARKAAEEEAARKAQEEADRKAAEARANADMDQVRSAQDRLAAGEIDFATYLQEAGLQDAYTGSLGIQTGLGATGSAASMNNATDSGYVASDGPVNTKTGQHTVENEMDGATAASNYKAAKAKVNDNDDPHMSHDEIIAHHKALQEAETDLIQSDLSDDEFWDAYEDDDDGGSDDGGGSSSGGK